MRLKSISILLFTLFCVVIAFPGYGKARAAVNRSTQPILKITPDNSVTSVLLKCLSSGINMIEEERTNEEDDDASQDHSVFIPSYTHSTVATRIIQSLNTQGLFSIEPLTFLDIFSPPDLRS